MTHPTLKDNVPLMPKDLKSLGISVPIFVRPSTFHGGGGQGQIQMDTPKVKRKSDIFKRPPLTFVREGVDIISEHIKVSRASWDQIVALQLRDVCLISFYNTFLKRGMV